MAADAFQGVALAAGGGGEPAAQRMPPPVAEQDCGGRQAGHDVGDGLGSHPAVGVADGRTAPGDLGAEAMGVRLGPLQETGRLFPMVSAG
ncbi:hypothetical protein [Planomonospora parontospora]|uniref:hypothetical protein n=1 Tax=Planomonospora parontospora TaxID=58119 RepID=UPI0016703664|nr:hypothetical protein [Planomonospora parontospora]GGL40452.1 hypothetical protein GCM10014719_46970 [Planomonospora parontospora subsp. antibiotica]GII18270.1 hypothetical protein Ppa05_49960 [Planomonospora parontospora subsp. antibiotica]